LRGGASGPSFEGSTPGFVLTVDADGKKVSPQPVPVAPGGLVSFNGRTAPAALPTAGDYGTDEVTNTSTVPGLTDEDALEFLQGETEALELEVDAAAAAAAAAQSTANGAQTTANAAGAAAAVADAKAVAAQQTFRGTYHVDPSFAGTQLGSESNPFTTIAAAFAAGALLALTAGVIIIAPGAICTENVTFPTTGEWDLAGELCLGAVSGVQITGNIDVSSTASCRRSIRGVRINGNVSGNASAGTHRILFMSSTVTGTVTLTTTGAGIQRLGSGSYGAEAFSGIGIGACNFAGAVAVNGTVDCTSAIFGVSLSFANTSLLSNCLLPPLTILTGTGSALLYLFNSANALGGSLGFQATGGGFLQLQPDDVTNEELMRVGATPRTGDVRIFSNISRGFTGAQVTNVGVTPIVASMPKGMMVIECCLTLLTTSGTAAGNAVLNVVYTDMTGTLVTEQVTTAALNVAGAVGSKARGVLPISQNGATQVSFSVTGITNATGLSYQCDVRVRQAS